MRGEHCPSLFITDFSSACRSQSVSWLRRVLKCLGLPFGVVHAFKMMHFGQMFFVLARSRDALRPRCYLRLLLVLFSDSFADIAPVAPASVQPSWATYCSVSLARLK
eukprot:4235177-Pyramimonas_sp.AAC.1